jgi:hypothetical protein
MYVNVAVRSAFIYILPTSSTSSEVAVDRGQRGFVVTGVKVGGRTVVQIQVME